HNEKIREVIDTIGKKGVLLLGRFTEGRMVVLERPAASSSRKCSSIRGQKAIRVVRFSTLGLSSNIVELDSKCSSKSNPSQRLLKERRRPAVDGSSSYEHREDKQ